VWPARTSLGLLALVCGCASAPTPGAFAFGVLGDTPYSGGEVERLERLIDDMNGAGLAFVVHVGDIGAGSQVCTDAWLDARRKQLARVKAPLVMIPGDNEWSDCRDGAARLAAWRRVFCAAPFPVERQAGDYCEHRRWEAAGFLFVTLNVPGSNNNLRRDPAETARRMPAVLAWLDESAALAEQRGAGLIVMMQADPWITLPHDGYAALRERLERLAQRRPYKVILVHGDTHLYADDEPLPGLRRLEVWGSPIVSFVRGEVVSGELRFNAPRIR
jgi:hypothetical protein